MAGLLCRGNSQFRNSIAYAVISILSYRNLFNDSRLCAKKVEPDKVLAEIADYVLQDNVIGEATTRIAHLAFMDFLGCAFAALDEPDCLRLIKPLVPEMTVPSRARIPGTGYELDPAATAFGFCALGRWLDYNDS